MASFTRNGWLASRNPADFGGLDNTPVVGVKFAPGFRDGAPGALLRMFFARFHTDVEPLVAGWCWGYAYRAVRAGVALSEHSAGVAGDANAPRHPLGKAGTFTRAQVGAIRRLLAEFSDEHGPLIRWGGDFGRPDEMHFELIASLGRVEAFVARRSQPGAPVRPPTPPAPIAPTDPEDWLMALDDNEQHEVLTGSREMKPNTGETWRYLRELPDRVVQEIVKDAAGQLAEAFLDARVSPETGTVRQTLRDARQIARRAEAAALSAPGALADLDDTDLAAIAKAVADEHARRLTT